MTKRKNEEEEEAVKRDEERTKTRSRSRGQRSPILMESESESDESDSHVEDEEEDKPFVSRKWHKLSDVYIDNTVFPAKIFRLVQKITTDPPIATTVKKSPAIHILVEKDGVEDLEDGDEQGRN